MTEYKPTEYVVDFGDYRSSQFVRMNMALIEQNGARLHEEIVRCRDCRWYEDGICYQPDGDGGLLYWEREPDGFCAWGKKED